MQMLMQTQGARRKMQDADARSSVGSCCRARLYGKRREARCETADRGRWAMAKMGMEPGEKGV